MRVNTNSEVDDFIYSLEKSTILKTLKTLKLLKNFGFNLGIPHSKSMGGGIFELRVKNIQAVRLFYCFHEGQKYILWGFIKKTQQTPMQELFKARNKYKLLTS